MDIIFEEYGGAIIRLVLMALILNMLSVFFTLF